MRHGLGRVIAVNGNADKFRSRTRELRHLLGGRCDIRGIRIGHALHDYWRLTADNDIADFDRNALPPFE